MDFLFDNPLANLPGPEFLVLYVLVIISTVIVFRVLKNRLDRTAQFAVPPIPHNPDPFEIAYLRGGANELARAVIFSLAQKNLVRFVNDEKVSQIHPIAGEYDRRSLQPIQLTALNWFNNIRDTKEIFKKDGLANALKPYSDTYQSGLEMQNFFPDEEVNRRNTRLTIQAFLIFGGFGAYKFAAALVNGYSNVFGIVLITFFGMLALGAAAKMPRLTKLGRTYLERLQIAFDKIKPSNHYVNPETVPSATFAAVDPFLLSVGVFGGAALAGTIYSDYNRTFERAQNQSAGSSGCGAGCGSGSSDGGSSGGDGGSSCSGGCGGGCGGCG